MAKKAVVNRDLKRRVTVKKYAKKRAALQASIANMRPSQPLRADRASSRRLQQVRAGPKQAARDCNARRDTRRGQGQLVMRGSLTGATWNDAATAVATELR